jgi:hypothetical protein
MTLEEAASPKLKPAFNGMLDSMKVLSGTISVTA